MAVHVVHFHHQGRSQWGVIAGHFASTADFLRTVDLAQLGQLDGATIDETQVEVLSPITRDQQFVCQGANYRQHTIASET